MEEDAWVREEIAAAAGENMNELQSPPSAGE
jgi:hypothetical protein